MGVLGRPPPRTEFVEPVAMPILSSTPRSGGALDSSYDSTNGRMSAMEDKDAHILSRGPTSGGSRNLQDSSFSVSGM